MLYKSLKFLHGKGRYQKRKLEVAMVTDARCAQQSEGGGAQGESRGLSAMVAELAVVVEREEELAVVVVVVEVVHLLCRLCRRLRRAQPTRPPAPLRGGHYRLAPMDHQVPCHRRPTLAPTRWLLIPLLNAERAWASANEIKKENEDRPVPARRHHSRRRLAKAGVWAAELARIAAEVRRRQPVGLGTGAPALGGCAAVAASSRSRMTGTLLPAAQPPAADSRPLLTAARCWHP